MISGAQKLILQNGNCLVHVGGMQIICEDSDGVIALGYQVAGSCVGDEIILFQQREDLLPLLLPTPWLTVDDPGDGAGIDTCDFCNVINRHTDLSSPRLSQP